MTEDNFVIKRIKELCENKDWTYYRLAKEADIPYTTIMNTFKKNTMPTIPTLIHICSGFGITLSQFFMDDGNLTELTSEQAYLLDTFNSLSAEEKKFCVKMLEELKELH